MVLAVLGLRRSVGRTRTCAARCGWTRTCAVSPRSMAGWPILSRRTTGLPRRISGTRAMRKLVVNVRISSPADHYGTAIVPAGTKPWDKAAVENAVNVVNKRVIGYLEDADSFYDAGRVERGDRRAGTRMKPGHSPCRWHDPVGMVRRPRGAPAGPLPDTPFLEQAQLEGTQGRGRNYHVTVYLQRYSVPDRLAGMAAWRVWLTSTWVTVFDGHVHHL